MNNNPTSQIKQLASLLRQARKECGLPCRAIAEETGIARQNLSLFELGKTDPKLSTVIAYAQAVGLQLTLTPLPDESNNNTPMP